MANQSRATRLPSILETSNYYVGLLVSFTFTSSGCTHILLLFTIRFIWNKTEQDILEQHQLMVRLSTALFFVPAWTKQNTQSDHKTQKTNTEGRNSKLQKRFHGQTAINLLHWRLLPTTRSQSLNWEETIVLQTHSGFSAL